MIPPARWIQRQTQVFEPRLQRKIPGTTRIIIAQRVSSVESADRILVLDNGKIDAFDTHENLLKSNAIYQEIYNSQARRQRRFRSAGLKGGKLI